MSQTSSSVTDCIPDQLRGFILAEILYFCSMGLLEFCQSCLQRAVFHLGFAAPVLGEQFLGALGQHSADFAAFAFHSRDDHVIVARRLVTQPCNHRGLGALLDWDSLGAGDGSAADGRGVRGHGQRQSLSKFRVIRVKRQVRPHRAGKILDVFRLSHVAPFGIGRFSFCECFRAALRDELRPQSLDKLGRGPDPTRKKPASFFLLHNPVFSRGFDPPRQRRIPGSQQHPTGGNSQHLA